MYNKIILKNEWEPFVVKFDGREYNVPKGSFEAEKTLWIFIKWQAQKWWINVLLVERPTEPTLESVREDSLDVKDTPIKSEEVKITTDKKSEVIKKK